MDIEEKGNFNKKYKDWFITQYKQIYKPFRSPNEKLVQIVNNLDIKYSSINRIRSYRTMAYDIQLATVNIICTTCKIMDSKSSDTAIYGFIFTEGKLGQPVYTSDLKHKKQST